MAREAKTRPSLKERFKSAIGYIRDHKLQTSAILGSVALGASGLTAPLLTTTAGAGLLMAGSLYLLTETSDALVDHTAALGRKKELSPLLIGIGLGVMTSLPELFVSLSSIAQGVPEVGIGNIVGSNIANTLLILGSTAAIAAIGKGKGLGWKFNTAVMAGATAAFAAQLAGGALLPVAGAAMLGASVLYMAGSYFISRRDGGAEIGEDQKSPADHAHGSFNVLWSAAALGGLVYAADLLVNSASSFALGIGISKAVIGTLAVAVGTSLPELMVSINAARKKETDIAVGNILGSNIFNVLTVGGALALAGTVVPEAFAPGTALGMLNLGTFAATAALLTGTLAVNGGGIKKWQGYAALGLYAAYVAGSVILGGAPEPAVLPVLAP